jgi:hypothetical protein
VRYHECNLFGDTSKQLVANTELNGFYFLTANDAETRVLPTLLEAADDTSRMIKCATSTKPGETCCSEDEKMQGCETALAGRPAINQYCDWRYPGTTTDATTGAVISTDDPNAADRATCAEFPETVFKTKCLRAAQKAREQERAKAAATSTCSVGACKTHDFTKVCAAGKAAVEIAVCEMKENDSTQSAFAELLASQSPTEFLENLAESVYEYMSESAAKNLFRKKDLNEDFDVPPVFGCTWHCEDETPPSISECTTWRYGSAAGNLREYCAKKSACGAGCAGPARGYDATAAQKCLAFTPTDELTFGHDNWYNTLERN